MNKQLKNIAFWVLLALVIVFFFKNLTTMAPKKKEVNYSDFITSAVDRKIPKVTITEREAEGMLYEQANQPVQFHTYLPENDPTMFQKLEHAGVSITIQPQKNNYLWNFLYQAIIPTLVFFILFWFLVLRQMQGPGNKALAFGKSKARLFTSENQQKVTFQDVAGTDEAKQELQEIIEFLKDRKKFQKVGAKIPKGVLLVGPPGTGKTLLAKAIAGEANVPFLTISGSDFVEMFVGVGASRVRDLFDQGKKNAPCIIFMDEIDAVGRHRGAGLGGGHDEREQTLNALLVEMDGFGANEGVILIAATNRPDILDPALLRPGRFDRHVVVDRPDLNGREAILRVHSKEKQFEEIVDLKVIARRTPGFVGSDLANLMNEAAILTARRNKEKIGMSELEEAIDRVMAGPERKSRIISEKEKKTIAYHESGHALVAKLIPGTDPVHKVSIIPRGPFALGYTLQLPIEDRYLTTKTELLNTLVVLMGGRVAEIISMDETSSGAHNDLERATEIAHKMVCEYGMSEKIGPMTLGKKEEQIFLGKDLMKERNFSEQVAYEIDMEVKNLIAQGFEKAKSLLLENRNKLEQLMRAVLEFEVLEAEEVDLILNGKEDELREKRRIKNGLTNNEEKKEEAVPKNG